MASSSSQTLEAVHGLGTITKINDAVYEFYRPATGLLNLEIIFFHGFQVQGSKDAYVRTWMLADGSACWLNTWFSKEYPQSRIMSVSYDSNIEITNCEGRSDMYLVGECLAQSIIDLAGVGQSCPVVLVGHGLGGLVLKEVCCRAEHLQNRLKDEGDRINPYKTFLRRLKGAFFFSTPHLGTLVQANPKRRSPLMKYYEVLSADSARLNSSFQGLRKRHPYRWKTYGIIDVTENRETITPWQSANLLPFGRKPQSSPVVSEGSGRYDMDGFLVLNGADSSTICTPDGRSSSSFGILLKFVQGILEYEEWVLKIWTSNLQLPRVFIGMPERVERVVQTLQLGQAEPSRVSLVGMDGIGKSTLAKELLIKIRSQFDFSCYVEGVRKRLGQQKLHTFILDDLYDGNGAKVRMQDADAQSVWQILKGKKVLMILEDVDSEEQISILLELDWVRKGSRLLVTSCQRTEELMPTFFVYEVPFLSMDESMNLFLAHVSLEVPIEISKEMFHQVVTKCDGLPLTLEVIGSYLGHKNDLSIWEDALERLSKAESINGSADDRLWAKLRVSFDRLSHPEIRMFLDLAVFDKCKPSERRYDLHILRAVWDTGINRLMVSNGLMNLVDKCFIRITTMFDSNSLSKQPGDRELQYLAISSNITFVSIHEQLRDMGKSIARPYDIKIEVCRGLWQMEDVDDLLAKYKGEDAHAESLSVFVNHTVTPRRKQYTWRSISHLRRLHLLRISNVGMRGDDDQRFPPDLGFFEMSTCCRRRARRPSHFLENDCWPIRAEDVGGLDFTWRTARLFAFLKILTS